MLTLPNWIHKILKGYGYYSILSNLINEGLRASSSTNTPKSWSIKIKLHCLKTCTSSVLKVQRKVEGDSSSGEILGRLSRPRVWASSAPRWAPQCHGRKRSITSRRERSFSRGLLLATYKLFEEKLCRKKCHPTPQLVLPQTTGPWRTGYRALCDTPT